MFKKTIMQLFLVVSAAFLLVLLISKMYDLFDQGPHQPQAKQHKVALVSSKTAPNGRFKTNQIATVLVHHEVHPSFYRCIL